MLPPDLLAIDRIYAELPNYKIHYFDEIESTNSFLISLKDSAASVLALAEGQTGGRGRRSKAWLSPHARSLSMSIGLATSKNLAALGGLSSVVGIALCNEFHALGATAATLKWPNDVLVDGAKLSGILVELQRIAHSTVAVIGVGVNVELTDGEIASIEQNVTDLRRQGVELDRTGLVVRLVTAVVEQIRTFELDGFEPFVEQFNALHCFHNQTCEILSGANTFSGVVRGIDRDGALQLEDAQGVQSFHGGEVSLRSKH